jgi:hypothetical protein
MSDSLSSLSTIDGFKNFLSAYNSSLRDDLVGFPALGLQKALHIAAPAMKDDTALIEKDPLAS